MFHVEHLQSDGGPECFTWNIAEMANTENLPMLGTAGYASSMFHVEHLRGRDR